ncbi:RNA polymerase sigma factor, partial [Singulisphaera rosea]
MTLSSSTPTPSERTLDSDLWILVCRGSVEAFEVLVKRHQSLVAAVAYNACGDLALSEDVAQETF